MTPIPHKKTTATLLISCPDQRGLVAAVSGFLAANDANIVHSDQHVDAENSLFLMRVEWELDAFRLSREVLQKDFGALAANYRMDWKISFSDTRPRLAILVSKYDHCLADLLYRHRTGELACELPLIISNHEDARELCEFYRIPFHPFEMNAANKAEVERKQLELLARERVDFVVLARYMQILSPEFVAAYPRRIINIHHSFLPAFLGARPYHRAFERGVKIIGATSHYVTDSLDEGPIIDQDVIRISHRDTVEDLVQKGQDLEKVVLSRAVRWHIQGRIISYGNKTVIFD